jgi:hypothetical protein
VSAGQDLSAAFERLARAGVARRRHNTRWLAHMDQCRTCRDHDPRWPFCPDGRTIFAAFRFLNGELDAAADFLIMTAPDFAAEEGPRTEEEVERGGRPLDDRHPISREFIAQGRELLRAAAAGQVKSYEDVLALDGITEPERVRAIYAIVQHGVETTLERAENWQNIAQSLGDGLLSCIRGGIRLARKGLV